MRTRANVFCIVTRLPVILVALFFLPLAVVWPQDYGDALVGSSVSDARTLVPILASDSVSSEVCGYLFNGLVKFDKDLNLTGDLASGWEISHDGLTITFFLRRGVRWHDGAPFTAADVAFTYRSLIDPAVRTPYGGDFERVRDLEVVDEYTVKVTYKEPFAPALSSWGMAIMPEHILAGKDLSSPLFARNPVGTGPYKLKKWRSQEKIELSSNRDYFEKRPFIDRIITRIIPDEATTFLELLTEGLDSAGLTPLQYLRQTDTPFFKRVYEKYRLPGFIYVYLGYNLKNPLFSDVRVRRALNLAVDKNEIIAMVNLGQGTVATGPFVPQSWAYDPAVKPAGFDRNGALALLREAGWSDSDSDGVLDKDGRNFEFTILTNQGNEERLKSAQIIQRRLKDIGIKVSIKVAEWSVFLTQHIDKRDFDAVILGWTAPREPDNFDVWHSSKTKEGEFNFVGYNNPEVDDALVAARRTFDQKERQKYYHHIHELLYRDQPYMFLYVPDSLSVLHKRFRGVKPAAAGIGYNLIEWWVPRQEQKYRLSPEG